MKIKIFAQNTTFRFYTEDKQIVFAYKKANSSTAHVYLHKNWNDTFKNLEGVKLKPDLEKNPDDYEYMKLIKVGEKETAVDAIKKFLKDNLKDVQFATVKERPDKKKPAEKKPADKKAESKKPAAAPKKKDKPEIVFRQITKENAPA